MGITAHFEPFYVKCFFVFFVVVAVIAIPSENTKFYVVYTLFKSIKCTVKCIDS